MSLFEVALRFKLNVTVMALIKLSEAANTLEIYVQVILVQAMVSLYSSLNSAGAVENIFRTFSGEWNKFLKQQ